MPAGLEVKYQNPAYSGQQRITNQAGPLRRAAASGGYPTGSQAGISLRRAV